MSTVDTSQNVYAQLGLTGSGSASSATQDPAAGNGTQKMDFLKLMTAQIKNQNPLNPLDGQNFLAQLAQFSVVDGITKLNSAFGDLSKNLVSDQSLQAAGLVGRQVQVTSDTGYLSGSAPLTGSVNLPAATGDLRLSFYNQTGELTRQLDLGPQPAGPVTFSWDGTRGDGSSAAAGSYAIQALAGGGQGAQAVPVQVNAQVDSVDLGGSGGLVLNLAGVGPVAYSDVKTIQ